MLLKERVIKYIVIMDKYVLLSGSNGGIGRHILSSLTTSGYKVISLDISDSNIKDMTTTFIKCDVTSKHDLEKAFKKISKITSKLDAIINTVGIFKMESIIEGSEEDFRKIFDINFFGIYSLNKMMFPLLQKGSKIVNLTSEVSKYSPQPLQAYYNLSKITLDKYTDSLRRECNYLGIKVVKIQSGSMKTTMLNTANDDFEKMASKSKYFSKPMMKLKHLMDNELTKTNDPKLLGDLVAKILNKENPRICYKIKNSFKLAVMGALPESIQDKIYTKVIK